MEHIVKILKIENITHDVKRFVLEKPEGYNFKPGQATSLSINKNGLKEEKRPFTFTSLNSYQHLELTIKIYEGNNGVTKELGKLKKSDELIIGPPWGTINYKGPGYFIAGGAGITPFIAIFRHLQKENQLKDNVLYFSNKTEKDIILKDEFEKMLGKNFINVITHEESEKYINGFIDKDFLKKEISDFSKHFYICGPPKMTESIQEALKELGAKPDTLVFE
ncbi:MAG: FAD-binding oxidoreductase [Thiohalospira sp.]